jgi:hypothetical protein
MMVLMLAGAMPAEARGPHGGGLFGHVHHGHPINAWMGSRRPRWH